MCPVFFSINLLDFNYNLLVLDDHELYKITVYCDDGLPKIVLWKATIISFYHSQDLRLYSICWKESRKSQSENKYSSYLHEFKSEAEKSQFKGWNSCDVNGSFVWNQIFVVLILNFRNSDPNFTKFIGFWHWQSSRVKVISKVI